MTTRYVVVIDAEGVSEDTTLSDVAVCVELGLEKQVPWTVSAVAYSTFDDAFLDWLESRGAFDPEGVKA